MIKMTPGLYRAVTMVALPVASLYLMWRSRKQPAYREYWDVSAALGKAARLDPRGERRRNQCCQAAPRVDAEGLAGLRRAPHSHDADRA